MAPFAANPPQGDRGVRGPRAEVMQLPSGKSRARAAFAGNREDWTVFEPDRGPLDRSASSYAASAAVANRGRGLLLVVVAVAQTSQNSLNTQRCESRVRIGCSH